MVSAPNLPVQIPDIHDLSLDLDDLADRIRDMASGATGQARKAAAKRQKQAAKTAKAVAAKAPLKTPLKSPSSGLPRLTWPLIAVVSGLGLFLLVRSRRSSGASDKYAPASAGAYARN